jgi:hypothetical protein
MSLDGRGATGSEAYLLMALHPQQESIPALPPPESQKTTIWRRWKSTKLQVTPTLSGWSLLAELGRFWFWCCQSVANAPPRNLANRVFLAERSL